MRDLDLNKHPGGHKDDLHELESHNDWAIIHDSTSGNTKDTVWSQSGGIWSKSQPNDFRPTEKVVWVKGEFVPGEHEVPEGEVGEGHSPMK